MSTRNPHFYEVSTGNAVTGQMSTAKLIGVLEIG
jgi:hypothetical protein